MTVLNLQFLDDAGMWNDVSAHTNARMLDRVTNGHLSGDDGHYRYDLLRMVQRNPRTGRTRLLRLRDDCINVPAWGFVRSDGSTGVCHELSHAVHARLAAGLDDLEGVHVHAGFETYVMHMPWTERWRGVQVNLRTDVQHVVLQHSYTLAAAQSSGPQFGASLDSSDVFDAHAADTSALAESGDEDDDDAPYELCCPITHRLMKEPVMASDGTLYERAAIVRWFSRKQSSPVTNLALDDLRLTEDPATLLAVASYRATRSAAAAPSHAESIDDDA
jgi:hypothetical protein